MEKKAYIDLFGNLIVDGKKTGIRYEKKSKDKTDSLALIEKHLSIISKKLEGN